MVSVRISHFPARFCAERSSAQSHPPSTAEQRADILMARKMYREAVEVYKEGPLDSPVIWNKIGIAYHQMLQIDEAKRNYEKAIKLNPKYSEAINNLGTIYYSKEELSPSDQPIQQGAEADAATRLRSTAISARPNSPGRNTRKRPKPTRRRSRSIRKYSSTAALRHAAAGAHCRGKGEIPLLPGENLCQRRQHRTGDPLYPHGA